MNILTGDYADLEAAVLARGFDPARDAYAVLTAAKEQALAGWIAWVALQNPNHPSLDRDLMHARFGPWIAAPLRIERQEDGSYHLTDRPHK